MSYFNFSQSTANQRSAGFGANFIPHIGNSTWCKIGEWGGVFLAYLYHADQVVYL